VTQIKKKRSFKKRHEGMIKNEQLTRGELPLKRIRSSKKMKALFGITSESNKLSGQKVLKSRFERRNIRLISLSL